MISIGGRGGPTDVDGEYAGCIDKLAMSISSGKRKCAEEEQPGRHRIKSVVARRAQYVRDVYSDWEDNAHLLRSASS